MKIGDKFLVTFVDEFDGFEVGKILTLQDFDTVNGIDGFDTEYCWVKLDNLEAQSAFTKGGVTLKVAPLCDTLNIIYGVE